MRKIIFTAVILVILFVCCKADKNKGLVARLAQLEQAKTLVVRVAKLQIDSVQLDKYYAALREEIETSVQLEPGVLSLYAVAEKNNPSHVIIFEIYADASAYRSHLETRHFKSSKDATKDMVKSLELSETEPISLGAKQ